jgi:hypothetical protein
MINTPKLVFTAAVAAVLSGTLPFFASASAQSMSREGSSLPRYYDSEGAQHWGSWGPPAATQTVTPLHGSLYLYASPIRRHKTSLHNVR